MLTSLPCLAIFGLARSAVMNGAQKEDKDGSVGRGGSETAEEHFPRAGLRKEQSCDGSML